MTTMLKESTTSELPEGRLRSGVNLGGSRIQLRYDATKLGYHITSGLALYARNLKSLELGICIFEALSLCEDKDIVEAIKHVRTEFRRLELSRYETPASKQAAIVCNALRRLEGYRVRVSKQVEVWTKAA